MQPEGRPRERGTARPRARPGEREASSIQARLDPIRSAKIRSTGHASCYRARRHAPAPRPPNQASPPRARCHAATASPQIVHTLRPARRTAPSPHPTPHKPREPNPLHPKSAHRAPSHNATNETHSLDRCGGPARAIAWRAPRLPIAHRPQPTPSTGPLFLAPRDLSRLSIEPPRSRRSGKGSRPRRSA